jgi:hypothetical protein
MAEFRRSGVYRICIEYCTTSMKKRRLLAEPMVEKEAMKFQSKRDLSI